MTNLQARPAKATVVAFVAAVSLAVSACGTAGTRTVQSGVRTGQAPAATSTTTTAGGSETAVTAPTNPLQGTLPASPPATDNPSAAAAHGPINSHSEAISQVGSAQFTGTNLDYQAKLMTYGQWIAAQKSLGSDGIDADPSIQPGTRVWVVCVTGTGLKVEGRAAAWAAYLYDASTGLLRSIQIITSKPATPFTSASDMDAGQP